MSDGEAHPREEHASIESGTERDRLRDMIRDREERLGELTDQSLDILDRLAEARGHVQELETALVDRDAANVQLRGLLEDTRRRVRSTRSADGATGAYRSAPGAARVEVVLWPTSADLVHAWIDRAAAHVPIEDLAVLCPGASRPAEGRAYESDQRWPAHLWNLGMAVTEAPYVLFLAEGVAPREDLSDVDLGGLNDESVVLGQPVLQPKTGERTAGLSETHHLHLERRPLDGSDATSRLEFASPEAFVLRREAYERLGPFDEDLRGVDALVEYALRARALDFRIVECRGLAVTLAADVDLLGPKARLERDRLIVLAQHRPDSLGEAIARSEPFFSLASGELAELLRALFRRLSGRQPGAEAIELLVRSGVDLARQAVDGRMLDERLEVLEHTIERMRSIEGDEPRGRDAVDLENRARTLSAEEPGPRLERIELLLQAQARDKARMVERLHAMRVRLKEITEEASRALDLDHQNALNRAIAADQRANVAVAELTAMRERAFGLHEQVADARARLRDVERAKNEEIHRIHGRHQEQLDAIAAAIGGERGLAPDELVARAALVMSVLRDRERWLENLIDEMGSRVLPRRLRPDERSFLAERRPAGDPRA